MSKVVYREIRLFRAVIKSLKDLPGERTAECERLIAEYRRQLHVLNRSIPSRGPRRIKLPGITVDGENAP